MRVAGRNPLEVGPHLLDLRFHVAVGPDCGAEADHTPGKVGIGQGDGRAGGEGDADLSPWPSVQGGPPLFLGTWGRGVERAAREFDGWIASASYRTTDQVIDAHGRFRAAGGGRAVVSTIQLPPGVDLGVARERLARFAEAGFDDAVVLILPGGPEPGAVRRLVEG